MSATSHIDPVARGDCRLIRHCLQWPSTRPPVRKRLEVALGPELAERLLSALAGDQRRP
jgi:hypothetical protein